METGRDAAEFLLMGANSVQVNPCAQGLRFTVDATPSSHTLFLFTVHLHTSMGSSLGQNEH